MKNLINFSFFSGSSSGGRKKLFTAISFITTTVLIFSCRKEIDQKFDAPFTTTDSATNGQSERVAAGTKNTYYVSPTGNDNNPGTLALPFKTLDKLSSILTAGDNAYVRGGTYRITKPITQVNRIYLSNLNGTPSNNIYIYNYLDEKPVFNMDEQLIPGSPGDGPVGLKIENCSYLQIKGIRITGIKQNPANINSPAGVILFNVDNSVIEEIEIDHVEGYGMYFQGGSDNNLVKNCDAHHLGDPYSGWGGANGFNITGGDPSTNNTFDGCRAWWCSDDGFDFFGTNTVATLKNCWSFWNGYVPGTFNTAGDGQGFKLGPNSSDQSSSSTVYRKLYNCLGFQNRLNGFDQNAQSNSACLIEMYNCTAYDNKSNGFFFGANTSINQRFKNNINYGNGIWGTEIQNGPNVSNNTWNGAVTVTNADFLSLSSVGADGPRQQDGSLPILNFLKLAPGSDLINAGINVGIPYSSTAPDIGAFESGGGSSAPANQAPVANAGTDKNINLPVNSVVITGSGSDPDGTITSYVWTFRTGPNTPVLSGSNTNTLSASGLLTGTYVFRLTVTDNGGLTAYDEVNVVVATTTTLPPTNAINISQVVPEAGYSYYVVQNFGTLPDDNLNPTRSVLRIFENGVELLPPHSSHSDIRNLGNGRFSHWSDGSTVLLYFSASDNSNPKTNGRTYTYSITSSAPSNQSPVANAGADKNITLPVNSVSITGNGTDPDGTISSYAWTFRSGPNTPVISGITTNTLSAGSLIAGTYVFRLTVTDNGGLTAYDEVNVVVSGSTTTNQAPVANAGPDRTITLPVNSITLTGSGTDPDGTIASYTWTRRSGPNTPILSGASTTTLSASNLIAGTYVFRLTVKDNLGKTAYDQVNVIVKAATAPPPTSLINVSQAGLEAGFSYYIVQDFGTLPDDNSNPTRSVLRIFENGIELLPPHSSHNDIRNIGRGRFSHWSDGSSTRLYFSTSDNSNPKTNGRTYTYTIQ